jgi:SAM-dependent methyltransferase
MLPKLLGKEFLSAHLFTTQNDFQLEIGRKGKSRLNIAKPTFNTTPSLSHDREKKNLVDPNSFYLCALGITTDKGDIREKQRDKWKQINKFAETLSHLFEDSPLKDREKIRIADMGCGKGYLTFATYDYFKNVRSLDVELTGVDTKQELVGLCNDIARACDFEGLKFVHGFIDSFALASTDILIALHACDTATDDAIFQGIRAEATLIVVAPCCQHELRPQIVAPEILKDVLRHGIILEREAETLTDGMRALLLEREGYSTKIFEFISTEHTPKNNMIVGTRTGLQKEFAKFDAKISELKNFFGIKSQRLESLLNERNSQTINETKMVAS